MNNTLNHALRMEARKRAQEALHAFRDTGVQSRTNGRFTIRANGFAWHDVNGWVVWLADNGFVSKIENGRFI